MPVNAMKRLTVIVPAEDTDLLLRRLMHLGCTELTERPTGEGELSHAVAPVTDKEEITARLDRVRHVLPVLAERRHKHRHVRAEIDYSSFLCSKSAERAEKTVTETEKILEFTAQTAEKIQHEQELMHALLPYLDFPYPLDNAGTAKTKFLLGSLPANTSAATLGEIADSTGFVAKVLLADKSGTYIAVITHRDTEAATREALMPLSFTEAFFADTQGRVVTIFDAAQKRAAKYRDDLKHAHMRLDVLAENYGDVCALFDVLQANEQTAALKEKLLSLGSCTVLTAWCPAFETARITRVLDAMTVAYDFTDPEITEKPPRPAAEPPYTGRAASLFAIYRTPWYGKWNAAVPLTVFYALLFGLLFADVGYGLVALIAALAVFLPKRTPTALKRAALLLGCCGGAMILFGVPLGHYFGSTLLTLLRETDATATLIPLVPLANALAVCRARLLQVDLLLAVAVFPALTYLCTLFVLRIIFLVRAHRAREIPLVVGPHLCFFAGLGLFWLHPIVAAIVLAVALICIVTTGILAGSAKKEHLIAIGGGMIDLLCELTQALCAARTLPLALITMLCLWPILQLAPNTGVVWLTLLAALLCFALSHALNLLLNKAPALVGRAKLCYMARFAAYYPGRAILHRPMKTTDRYTRDTSLFVDTHTTAAAHGDSEEETSTHDPASAPLAVQ
ncbi:MAG: hypothetical protein E7650_00820 [Ruminococcaceae bacterium]|nr:hypothetical protein [Oscillospiraceae bacterium]